MSDDVNALTIVLDTNVLISRALSADSVSAQAVRVALQHCRVIVSQDTVDELIAALSKRKFRPYLTEKFIEAYVVAYIHAAKWVPIIRHFNECRDQKDNKFLDLAYAGAADLIITGDDDLLSMKRFKATRIISPAAFLALSQRP